MKEKSLRRMDESEHSHMSATRPWMLRGRSFEIHDFIQPHLFPIAVLQGEYLRPTFIDQKIEFTEILGLLINEVTSDRHRFGLFW